MEFVALKGEANHWLTRPEYASLGLELKTSARCGGGLDYGRARKGWYEVQDEQRREDAKQLLRVAYERQVASGEVGVGVDLGAAAEERGISRGSPHLRTLTDYMEVTGWIVPDMDARVWAGDPLFLITERGMKVLRETLG